ncbi:MAG: hypothetical protein MJB14_00700 [Spirochaetes bacterium]|nr:hypothetical protein [Spirochaetota bacterium]
MNWLSFKTEVLNTVSWRKNDLKAQRSAGLFCKISLSGCIVRELFCEEH